MSHALDSVSILASDICEDIGDSLERHHLRLQKKLLEAYRMLYWYVLPDVEELENIEGQIFPNNGQLQYELPCNFVYETKVGILWRGHLITLDLKKDLRLNNTKYTDTQAQNQINGYCDGSIIPSEFMPFYNLWRDGVFFGERYGMGCGFHSNQWYNIKDGVLEIGSNIPDDAEVVVEYKHNGISKDGFKLVPCETSAYCKWYAKGLHYEDSKPSLSADMFEKAKGQYQRLKRLYSYRTPEYLGFVFKSQDRPGRY